MPDYFPLKLLHMTAAAFFVGGLLSSTLAIGKPIRANRLAALRRWDRWVTTPALGAVWILGIILTALGGWYQSGWLPIKLVLVLALSGMHGMTTGAMKRLARGEVTPAFLRFTPYLIGVCVAAILVLVETKPF